MESASKARSIYGRMPRVYEGSDKDSTNKHKPFTNKKKNQEILTGWEDNIAKIARNTIQEQSPKQLYNIREELKKLTEHNVSPDFVLRTLGVELKKHLDEHFQAKLDALYQEYKTRDDRFLLGGDESLESPGSIQENSGDSFHDPRKNGQRFMCKCFPHKYKCAIGKHTSG